MAHPRPTDKRGMRLRFWLGYAVVLAIAIGSVALALIVHDRESDNFEQLQQGEAVRSARQTEALAGLSVGQLASATAFYRAVDHMTRHKFEVIANSLLHAGALSGTGLILSVPGAERPRFERARGLPITERVGLGFRREPARDEYFPLVYGASTTGLTPPLGLDIGSNPARAPYLLAARDSGRAAATRVMHLPIGGTGINVFRPVYRDGAAIATVAERRAALVGFAIGSFHVPDLTVAATSTLPDDVAVQLVEDGRTVAGPSLDRGESSAAALRIADRTWLLVVRDPGRPDVSLPILIVIVGGALAALLGALVLVWSRNEKMQELRLQASQDPLTGLKNRRRFGEDLRTELARSRREDTVGAVLMLDLDNFKQVNDTLGHPAGDRTIADIAAVLRGRMRATDVVARLGGDEFAIVLPRCDLDEAEEVADAIAEAIRMHTPPGEAAPPITASIGIATFGPRAESYDAVLSAADTAMYEAKRAGRDSVRVAGQAVSAGSKRRLVP
jgi:diguanylate cyclase (GGDEF)-like protein